MSFFLRLFSPPFHTQCSKAMVPGRPLGLVYRHMVIHEEICLGLTLPCPPQNTWSASVSPQMLQHRLPTPNVNMVPWITEPAAPAEHEGQGLAAARFLGNTSICPGHWMPLACGGSIYTGMTGSSSRHCCGRFSGLLWDTGAADSQEKALS